MATLTQLEYIIAVDKHRHFGRAAHACNVSQPSLSTQVQKVEDELGIVIFDRSKKPILQTDVGKKFIEQAKKIIHEHHVLLSLSDDREEVHGEFRLGVIPTLSAYIIPLFIENFSKKHPNVELKISEHKTDDILSMLYDDELDGALLVTPLGDPKIIERPLFFEPFYAFVSNSHPFYKRKTIADADLDGESIWLLNEGHCFRNQVIRLCALRNQNQVLKNIRFESGNLETLKNLIRTGCGYTLIPHLATLNLSPDETKKNLKAFKSPVPTREVSFVHSRSFLKEAIIDALTTEIKDSLPKKLKNFKTNDMEVINI